MNQTGFRFFRLLPSRKLTIRILFEPLRDCPATGICVSEELFAWNRIGKMKIKQNQCRSQKQKSLVLDTSSDDDRRKEKKKIYSKAIEIGILAGLLGTVAFK